MTVLAWVLGALAAVGFVVRLFQLAVLDEQQEADRLARANDAKLRQRMERLAHAQRNGR